MRDLGADVSLPKFAPPCVQLASKAIENNPVENSYLHTQRPALQPGLESVKTTSNKLLATSLSAGTRRNRNMFCEFHDYSIGRSRRTEAERSQQSQVLVISLFASKKPCIISTTPKGCASRMRIIRTRIIYCEYLQSELQCCTVL